MQLLNTEFCIRALKATDYLDMFNSYASDPIATKFLPWGPTRKMEDTRCFVDAALVDIDAGQRKVYAIVDDRDSLVGAIDFTWSGVDAEVGFVLATRYWHRGIMSEAVAMAINEFTKKDETGSIFAYADSENVSSRRVLEKTGFEHEHRGDIEISRPKLYPSKRSLFFYRKNIL